MHPSNLDMLTPKTGWYRVMPAVRERLRPYAPCEGSEETTTDHYSGVQLLRGKHQFLLHSEDDLEPLCTQLTCSSIPVCNNLSLGRIARKHGKAGKFHRWHLLCCCSALSLSYLMRIAVVYNVQCAPSKLDEVWQAPWLDVCFCKGRSMRRGCWVQSLRALHAMQVKLISSDSQEFMVDEEVAHMSETIKNTLEGMLAASHGKASFSAKRVHGLLSASSKFVVGL